MIKSKYKEYEIHKYTFTYDLEFRGTKTENGIGEMYLGRTLAEEKIEYESYDNNGNLIVKRISSEKNGFNGNTFGEVREKGSFGFGYNEDVLKRSLKK